LLIELKKGGFALTRNEVNQADGYVQDIAASGIISGSPYICAWVVGQKVAAGVGTDKKVGDASREYGRVRATTFGTLVDTANRRLLKLRDVLATRYGTIPTDHLLNPSLLTSHPRSDGNLRAIAYWKARTQRATRWTKAASQAVTQPFARPLAPGTNPDGRAYLRIDEFRRAAPILGLAAAKAVAAPRQDMFHLTALPRMKLLRTLGSGLSYLANRSRS
jgi:hypothetical protein